MSSRRGGASELGGVFAHPGVADAYRHRPPYPAEVFAILDRLVTGRPRRVLDIGAGEGALARPLAERVDHVDAVDVSAAMVEAGRQRPGGDARNLHWTVGAAETCRLSGPYGLVIAGASLHWMSWRPLMNRLRSAMADGACLAIVEHGPRDVAWHADLIDVIVRHSRNPDFDPRYSIVDDLCDAGFFDPVGRAETAPVAFRQPVWAYIEQFHSTASLARLHMSPDESTAFDRAIEDVVRPWAVDDQLDMNIVATLSWGRPLTPAP